jgi:hypothetical protein
MANPSQVIGLEGFGAHLAEGTDSSVAYSRVGTILYPSRTSMAWAEI